jgi:septal ring-binding cell division protein DamX
MTREDEYTITLSSGKIVMLISVALCAMLVCFVTGLVVAKSPQPEVSAPKPAPTPELTSTEQPAPKISLPEVPKSSKPPAAATTAPPKKTVAKKPAPEPAPKPVQKAPAVSASKELFAICVISVRSKDGAQDYANQLAKKGYKASVIRTQSGSGTVWYRTVIGEFPSRKSAEQQLASLKSKGEFKDGFVIPK